jgi:hypothetical protein
MGSVMTKELIGIKDHYGYWAFTMDIALTETKMIDDVTEFILLVKTYPDFFPFDEYTVEEDEIYAMIDNPDNRQINPGL